MSLKLASAVQIGRKNALVMMNTFHEYINHLKYGGLDFNRLRSCPFEGPAIVIPPALPEDTYLQEIWHKGEVISYNINVLPLNNGSLVEIRTKNVVKMRSNIKTARVCAKVFK